MKTKRILALLVALIMVFQLMPAAFAEDSGDDGRLNDETVTEPAETPAEDPAEDPAEEPVLEPVDDPIDDPFRETAETQDVEYSSTTKTVLVGVINYLIDERGSNNWQVHYWKADAAGQDALCTVNGKTETKDVGYWNAAQTFAMFTAEVPVDATGIKVHNGDRWFGADGTLVDHRSVYVFNYDGDKAVYDVAPHEWDMDHPDWGDLESDGDFGYQATITFTCTTCHDTTSVTASGAWVEEMDPNCAEPSYKCTTCTATFGGQDFSKEYRWDEGSIDPTAHPFNLTHTAANAATCETAGNSEYWYCGVCDKYFSDEDGEHEIAENSWVIPALGHDWGDWTETTPATCTEAGVETRTCSRDASHTETRAIEASGHAWGTPAYEWAADYSTCTATRVCANDESHVETETVNSTSVGPDDNGVTTYTATFANEAFAAQTKQIQTIGPIGGEPIEMGYLYFMKNDGSEEKISQEMSVLEMLAPECPWTREGFSFTGWNTKADGTGDTLQPGDAVEDVLDVWSSDESYFYAQWEVAAAPVAKIGDTAYPSLQAAVDAAHEMTGDVTVTLLADVQEVVVIHQKEGLNLTVDGDGKTVTGQFYLDGDGRYYDADTLTIQNVKFAYDAATYDDAFIDVPSTKTTGKPYTTGKYNYAHNIAVSNCEFAGEGTTTVAFRVASGAGANKVTLSDLSVTGGHSFAQLTGVKDLTITGCTASGVKNGINISGGEGTATISGNTLTAEGYTVRLKDNSSMAVTLMGNTFSGGEGIVSAATAGGTITIVDGKYAGPLPTDKTKFTVKGGVFSVAPTLAVCEEGKYPILNADPETMADYPYTVGDAVARIGETLYASLAEAVAAVPADGTETTVVMIADERIDVTGYAVTVPASKNIILDLNGHDVVGACASSGTSALIRNLGTLTIQDSGENGKLIGGADPTWTWDGSDDYSGSYASNLIRNEGTLVVNSGYLYNASTGSAAYAIDNYSAGKVTINGGTVDAKKASAIRLFYNNGGEITVNGGTIGHYTNDNDCTYMGIQVMSGTNVAVNVTGGVIAGMYALYTDSTGESAVNISGGTFDGYVGIAAAYTGSIAISGGRFTEWVGTWGSQTGFITGGVFAVAPDFAYCGKDAEDNQLYPMMNDDPETKDAFPFMVGIPVAVRIFTVKDGEDEYENVFGYATLEAAVAAAEDGDTVKLLKNASGNGIVVPQGKFTNGLVVDFDGHTYTVDGATVGSTGTETQAFQLLMDNNITFKNGTITSEKAKILVQNYSNLTLDGMTLTLDNENYAYAYTLSNNNGNITIKDTTINANPAGGFAFDVCRYSSYTEVHVTVTGNSVINGNIEVSASNKDAKDGFSLMLESGTFTGAIVLDASVEDLLAANTDNVWVKKIEGVEIEIPDGYTWKLIDAQNGIYLLTKAVAKIERDGKTLYFATLNDAVAAVQNGETIIMIADVNDASGIAVASGSNFTVDFDGHTYLVAGPGAGSTGTQTQAFQLLKDSTITFKNGILGYAEGNTTVKRMFQNYANLTLDNMTINAAGQAGGEAYVLSFNNGSSVLTNGTKIITTSNDTAAFDVYDWPSGSYTEGAHLKIEDAEINGKIVFDNSDRNRETGSTLEITGGKVGEVTHDGTLYDGQIVITGGVFRVAPLFAYCGKDAEGNQLYPIPNMDPETKEAYPYTVGIAVAKIGDVYYTTLEAAFADAIDGDTIVVLRDSAGNGIKVPQGKFTTGLTVDFNGHSYEIDGSLVGSTDTVSQAFQLLMDNNITFKNGTISSEKAYMLIQNYSSLTLENMTLDGSELIGSAPYTLSNNNGTIVIDGSEIIAKDGGFAFDVCRYASYKSVNVTVKGDSEINGNIEVYASNKDAKDGFGLMLESGTFTGAIVLDASVEDLLTNPPEKAWVKRDKTKVEIEIPAGYTWVDLEGNIQLLVKLMTVTFDADNGTEKVTVEVPKGQKVERPSDPVKDHYNFLGWFEEGAENAFDFETAITENVELKARWQGDAVMIIYTDYFTGRILQRFDVHYGDFKEAYTFTAADRITQRDGYHYNVNDMWTPPVADTATEDIVYVLKWIKGIAVTFDPDNGDEAEVVTVDRDTAVEKPATDPVKEGYTFAGWFDGNNAYDFTALVTGSLYLKAKWTPNKMTITFDTNGGSAIEAVEVDYDTAVTMPEAPTKDGFVFNGWTLNGEAYDFGKPVTSDITLTAQWLDAVAKIGDVMYLTLKDAVDAVQNGETIVLLKDTTTVDAENGLTYTIAMNGHTLTGITWVIDNTTLTLDGSAEGSAYNGSVYVGYATNNNGNVILDGGTYTCGAGNTVLHINGTCLNSNVTIRNAKVISPDDNGIQLNGFGEFVIENSEISGATGVYVKSGHLTITNSTITGSMSPANYTYNGNGAVATGDAIVIDSCEYPGGAPVVEIGDSNTFNGTKKQVGYYEFDANRDGETQEGRVTAKTNTLTVPDGYAWLKLADNEYLLVKAVAQVEDGYYATFEEAFAVEGVVGGEKIIKLLADGAEYEFHAGDVLKVQKANDAITFVYTADEGVIVKVSEPDENGTVTYTTAEPVAKIGSTYYTTVAEAIAAVNAGETIEVLKDVAENVTIAEGKSFTLDLGGHTLTGYVDQYDADVTVKNGTIAGTIYANGLAAGQNGKLTIEADATVKADYAIILYQASDNTGNGFTIDINGTVEGIVWVMGNIKEGSSVINVNDGATITGDDVGIALNGAAIVNVKDGATVTGTSTGIEVRAGELNVTGGTISGNGAATEVAANGSGTTTSGAGIAIAQHTTELDIKVNISGGTINGATSLNVANPQGNDEGSIAVAVTGGIFNGPVNVDERETRVEKFVSGGDFIETVKPEYVVDGKLCTTTLTEEINGTDYYYIVDAVKVTFDADEGAFPAAEGEEAATMIEVFVPAGEKVEAPEQPTRENYGFMGWFAENAEEAFDFANTAITADITLKAKWQGGVYTVTVTSSGDGTPTPGVTVAHVTGGGTFVIGEKTVVSAPVVTGYTFLGWYEVNGEKLSSEMEFEYTVRAEKNDLIAVYTLVQGATFRLTVTASRFTINDGTVQRSRFDDYYTAGSTVTLKYTGSDKFLYWVNDAKKIVSTSEEYTFTLVADTIVDAVYSENDASEEALVLFVSAKNYGQVISQRYYTNEEAIVFPTAPVTMGKTFVKWDKTEEEIHALMATETRIVVYPIYESNGGEYIVTIEYWVGDAKKDLEQKDPREVSTRTTLSVDETYDGESFSYWADDEGNILGYKAGSLVMRPTADVTVRAVYGVECEPVPVVRMTDAFASMNGDKTVLNFVATRSIPEGYTLERAGVLYAGLDRVSVADAKDKLTLPFYDGEGHGYILEGPFVAADLDDAAMLYFSTKKVDRQFIVRAYIVVKDAAGEVHYIYSDNVIYASYTELNNKVFHSVDITE